MKKKNMKSNFVKSDLQNHNAIMGRTRPSTPSFQHSWPRSSASTPSAQRRLASSTVSPQAPSSRLCPDIQLRLLSLYRSCWKLEPTSHQLLKNLLGVILETHSPQLLHILRAIRRYRILAWQCIIRVHKCFGLPFCLCVRVHFIYPSL